MLVFTSFPHFCTLTVWLFDCIRVLLNYSWSFAFDEREISICRDRVKTTSTTTTAQPKIRSQRSSVLLQTQTGDNQKCSGVFCCQKNSIINSYKCIINSFTIFLYFSIRENIVDEFTCEGRSYGYYADVANDCQVSLNVENLAYFREMAIIFTLSCSTSVTRWLTLMDKRRCSSGVSSAQTRPSLTRLTFIFLQLPKSDRFWPGWP